MQVVFMRQSHYSRVDPELRPLIDRFHPIRSSDRYRATSVASIRDAMRRLPEVI